MHKDIKNMNTQSLIKQEATFALLAEMVKGIQSDIKKVTDEVKQVKPIKK